MDKQEGIFPFAISEKPGSLSFHHDEHIHNEYHKMENVSNGYTFTFGIVFSIMKIFFHAKHASNPKEFWGGFF